MDKITVSEKVNESQRLGIRSERGILLEKCQLRQHVFLGGGTCHALSLETGNDGVDVGTWGNAAFSVSQKAGCWATMTRAWLQSSGGTGKILKVSYWKPALVRSHFLLLKEIPKLEALYGKEIGLAYRIGGWKCAGICPAPTHSSSTQLLTYSSKVFPLHSRSRLIPLLSDIVTPTTLVLALAAKLFLGFPEETELLHVWVCIHAHTHIHTLYIYLIGTYNHRR